MLRQGGITDLDSLKNMSKHHMVAEVGQHAPWMTDVVGAVFDGHACNSEHRTQNRMDEHSFKLASHVNDRRKRMGHHLKSSGGRPYRTSLVIGPLPERNSSRSEIDDVKNDDDDVVVLILAHCRF